MQGNKRCKKQTTFVQVLTSLKLSCITTERIRGLSERSLQEIETRLEHFIDYVRLKNISSFDKFTPEFIKDYVIAANISGSAAQGKMIIWVIRKFFSFLKLRQYITIDPAAYIPHPKERPRQRLPLYLKPDDLYRLLEYTAQCCSLQDFTILSLLCTAGPRPQEIVNLRPEDIFIDQECIFLHVKGGWFKRTPVSTEMVDTLKDYLAQHPPDDPVLFRNQRNKPIDKRWIERMVRDTAKAAGIKQNVTPRMLRHTFATYAADRHGFTVTRALLGHCCRSHSTDVYMHLIPSKFKKLMNCHPYQTTIRKRRKL